MSCRRLSPDDPVGRLVDALLYQARASTAEKAAAGRHAAVAALLKWRWGYDQIAGKLAMFAAYYDPIWKPLAPAMGLELDDPRGHPIRHEIRFFSRDDIGTGSAGECAYGVICSCGAEAETRVFTSVWLRRDTEKTGRMICDDLVAKMSAQGCTAASAAAEGLLLRQENSP